jgi:rhodanese-related sulfurtransferase
MSKFNEKSKDTFHPKKDEYFKRIKGSQLVELIEDEDVEEETVYGLVGAQETSAEVGPCVVHGEAAQDMDEALYLLLDLRDESEYDQCHISTAIPYPHTQLTHSTNYFSTEIYRYKNRPDRMIIIYDDDERIAAPAGKLFVERGVENVYVLTGGLRKFCEKHEEFVQGIIPEYPESAPPTAKSGRSKLGTSSTRPPPTGRSSASVRSAGSMASMQSGRSHGAPSLAMR